MADAALRAAERASDAAAPLDQETHDRKVAELLRAGRVAEARAEVLAWLDAVHARCDVLLDRGDRARGSVDHDEVDRLLALGDAAIAHERELRPRVLAVMPSGWCLCGGQLGPHGPPGYMPHEKRSAGCSLAPRRTCGRRDGGTRPGADGRYYATACSLGAGHRGRCRFLGLAPLGPVTTESARLLPSPGMPKRQPEPEPRGRGRPPLNASGAPPHTLTLRMSEETRDAAAGYAEEHGDPESGKALPLAEAFRELATAWSESEAVRKAVAAWRRGRSHQG